MKRISLVVIIAIATLGRPAFAVSPRVSGNYAFMEWAQCAVGLSAPVKSVAVNPTLGTVVVGGSTETVLGPPTNAPTTTNAIQALETNSGVTGIQTDSASGVVSSPQPGLMNIGVGYIDFTPGANSGGTSGTATGSIKEAGGGTLQLNDNGGAWQLTSGTLSGSYSLNAAAGTLTLAGATYSAAYGNIDVVGVVRTMYLVLQGTQGGNSNCLQAITATHQ